MLSTENLRMHLLPSKSSDEMDSLLHYIDMKGYQTIKPTRNDSNKQLEDSIYIHNYFYRNFRSAQVVSNQYSFEKHQKLRNQCTFDMKCVVNILKTDQSNKSHSNALIGTSRLRLKHESSEEIHKLFYGNMRIASQDAYICSQTRLKAFLQSNR